MAASSINRTLICIAGRCRSASHKRHIPKTLQLGAINESFSQSKCFGREHTHDASPSKSDAATHSDALEELNRLKIDLDWERKRRSRVEQDAAVLLENSTRVWLWQKLYLVIYLYNIHHVSYTIDVVKLHWYNFRLMPYLWSVLYSWNFLQRHGYTQVIWIVFEILVDLTNLGFTIAKVCHEINCRDYQLHHIIVIAKADSQDIPAHYTHCFWSEGLGSLIAPSENILNPWYAHGTASLQVD